MLVFKMVSTSILGKPRDGQRIIELVVDQESRALAKDGQFYYLLREFDQIGIVYEWCVGH